MAKSGIRIVSDIPGAGPEIKKGDHVRVRFDILLNRGEYLVQDRELTFAIGDRKLIAGFNYGLEGMRIGGARRFKASPHLCYRDLQLDRIPKDAVLIFDIKCIELLS